MKFEALRKSLALLCCVALISGCASAPAPQRFTGDRQSTPIHELSVAVVMPRYLNLSYNDKGLKELAKSQQALGQAAGPSLPSGLRLFLSSVYEPERLYRGIIEVYHQDFKSVTVVESISDPRVSQADLIAVPDVSFGIYPPNIGAVSVVCEFTLFLGCLIPWTTKTSLSVASVFYAPDHSPITTLKTTPVLINRHKMPIVDAAVDEKVFPAASARSAGLFDIALETSPELRQYATSLQSKLATAKVQPAPEERTSAKVFDSDADRADYHFDENAADYAVIIGVESYANVAAAPFAKRDAEAVRAHLRALGYPSQNIAMLTDSQATGNKLKSYIESWLPRNVKPESKVFFYFAGHGAPDAQSQQSFLLPWDGDPQYLADTGYPIKRLYEKLNELSAQQVIVAMDAGFSGAGGRSVLAKGARPLVARLDAGAASQLGKVAVLAAAGGDEITAEENTQGHGLFTYYLLKSLNDSGGVETLGKVYDRVKPRVQQAARQASQSQTPQLLGVNAAQISLR